MLCRSLSLKKKSVGVFPRLHIKHQNNIMESCKKCGEEIRYKWCKSCQIDNLKGNFTNGNEKIDV